MTPAPALLADSATETAGNQTFRELGTMVMHRGIDLVKTTTRDKIHEIETDPGIASIQRMTDAMSEIEIDVGTTKQMNEMAA